MRKHVRRQERDAASRVGGGASWKLETCKRLRASRRRVDFRRALRLYAASTPAFTAVSGRHAARPFALDTPLCGAIITPRVQANREEDAENTACLRGSSALGRRFRAAF